MKNIWNTIKLAKPLYKLFALSASIIILIGLIEQTAPILSKFIVDEIGLQIETGKGSIDKLGLLIGLSFAATILGSLINSINQRLGDHIGGKVRQFLTEKFYEHIFTLPQSYFDTEISGKIVNQLNRGIGGVKDFINTSTNFILPSFLQAIITIGILFYYSIPIAVLTTLLFPIFIYLSYYSSKKWGEREVEKNKLEDIGRGRISEVILNMRLVKAYVNQKNEYKFISKKQSEVNKIYAKQSLTYHKFDFLRNFLLNVILLGINIIVFYNTFKGNYTIGEMVLIIQLITQVRWPLYGMSFILTQIQNTESGTKEFFEIMNLPESEEIDKDLDTKVKNQNQTIEFKNVSFKYDTGNQIFEDVSFSIKNNEKIALIGHSGAGKSTITNLILKFYEPSSGDIYLNDNNYKELSHNFIRKHISLVFQENELFSSTIKENVSYGMKATDGEVIEALKQANAWGFVDKLKNGINSEVGERGVRLSGGQKQRIQIARAILHNRPIVILDEATSNLDSKSEHEVQEALEHLMKNKIVIIIAHRFSTIQNVDRIIVLNDGKIVDSGSPKELSQKEGIYRDLLQYQIEGDKKLLANFELRA